MIIGERAIFTRKTNNNGKPTGKPILTSFAFDFSAPIYQASATNPGNHQFDNVTTKKLMKRTTIILKPITKFAVTYSAGSEIVDLSLIGTQPFSTGGQLDEREQPSHVTGWLVGLVGWLNLDLE